jgi:hypothetical protein
MAKKPKTQFNIRISEELLRKLTTAANRNHVTVSAEAAARLEASFDRTLADEIVGRIERIIREKSDGQ